MHTVVALETSQILYLARTVRNSGTVPRTSSKKAKSNQTQLPKTKEQKTQI